jgi:hypothetical protein
MPITVALQGRLGNQLFQYACCRSISLKKNFDMFINTNFNHDQQQCLLENFNLYNNKSIKNPRLNYLYKEGQHSKYKTLMFDENVKNIQNNTILTGYFQNFNYFKDIKDTITNDFKLDKNILDIAENYLNKLKKDKNKTEIISINIRRGDYNNLGLFNEKYVVDFINNSLSKINNVENKIILIFIGGSKTNNSNKDIEWVKKNILYENIVISPYSIKPNILLDMAISKICDYMIIPIMSSITWWILFLNKNNPLNNFVPFKDPQNNIISYDDNYNIINT